MTRRTAALLASLLLAACARAPQPQVDAAVSSPDGSAGAGGTGGSPAPDTGAGTGGAVAAPPDGPVVMAPADAAAPADAPVADGPSATSDGNAFPGIIPDGAPWQRQCPPGATRSDCCVLYCACMTAYCPATIPKDCQTSCENGQNWDLVCRNYQCFASQNPNFPQDHDSHCRHAIGLQGRCGDR